MVAGSDPDNQDQQVSPFGHLLRRLRTAASLTQEELAERAGVSARLISELERGRILRPRRDTIQMLTDGLALSGEERETFIEVARGRQAAGTPATAAPAISRQFSLPRPPTAIVGREREVTATTSLLNQAEVRLLTLTGAGGVGKTRLALEAAARVAGTYSQGVVFGDLAPVADPALVIPTIARALGVRDSGDVSPIEQLIAALDGVDVLVVLDNFEHLISAAPDIAALLERCPGLNLLVTSRQPLRLRAEREYPVSPLALPDLERLPPHNELSRIPAIDLLVRRAEAVRPSFALTPDNEAVIAEIAVRLDGLPLAIELAAARMRILSPDELLLKLERRLPLLTTGAADLPARQQTLRATIEWSHGLLDEAERRLFRRLSVFSGGFTLGAAEFVSSAPDQLADGEDDVLDCLSSLVDKNLLTVIQPGDAGHTVLPSRYGMLETIREYGLEQLAAAGEEDTIRARHAAWCVDLVERAQPELTGPDQQHWFRLLEVEHDNIRSALRWSIARGDSDSALRLCGSLYRFWVSEAMFAEGRSWTEQALAIAPGAPGNPQADSLLGLGVIAYFQGDYDKAEACTEEALRTFQATDNPSGVAFAYANLGLFADVREEYEKAAERFERSLEVFKELQDDKHAGFMYGNLGLISYFQGDYERAEWQMNESLAISRARGDANSNAMTLGNLALVALARGELDRAEELQREALEERLKVVNKSHLARNLDNFAHIAAAKQELERAVRLFAAAEALRTELGSPLQPNDKAFNDRCIEGLRAEMSETSFNAAWNSGLAMSSDEATGFALRTSRPPVYRDVPSPHDDD